jgi:hypothetical protein
LAFLKCPAIDDDFGVDAAKKLRDLVISIALLVGFVIDFDANRFR